MTERKWVNRLSKSLKGKPDSPLIYGSTSAYFVPPFNISFTLWYGTAMNGNGGSRYSYHCVDYRGIMREIWEQRGNRSEIANSTNEFIRDFSGIENKFYPLINSHMSPPSIRIE
ncbi:hypothetical protein LOAG_08655 [Loa loa]|uniref:Uncharacterized protein n=1 Tax=Loa loa TaxID=7209 RepID=A0A1S0TTU4_LOALO|nr:hypothetical protein LOAG_08655 [Loa loa]EFO19838.1 hypothetical protein LOAG_08655 [Loa loa]